MLSKPLQALSKGGEDGQTEPLRFERLHIRPGRLPRQAQNRITFPQPYEVLIHPKLPVMRVEHVPEMAQVGNERAAARLGYGVARLNCVCDILSNVTLCVRSGYVDFHLRPLLLLRLTERRLVVLELSVLAKPRLM